MKPKITDCPCSSGARYRDCCRPYHQGGDAPDAEKLMRSRFSAYALGEVDYLWETLDPEHPDRMRPQPEVMAELRAFSRGTRFVSLRVLEHEPARDTARVLFHAELFQQGREISFAELSSFVKRADGWRYQSGETVPLKASDPKLAGLSIGRFPGP